MPAGIKDTTEWRDFEEWLTVAWKRSRARPNDREWAFRLLLATAEFINRVDPENVTRFTSLFLNLSQAIVELENGIVSPLLRPKVMGHRPPDGLDRKTVKEIAAVAMTLLMDRRFARPEAAKVVVGCLCDCGVKADGRRQLNWSTVASWRDQMKKPPLAKAYAERLAIQRREFAKECSHTTNRSEMRRLLQEHLLLLLMRDSEEIRHAVLSGKMLAAAQQFEKIARTYSAQDSEVSQAQQDSK
jgi:hypothetical protein